MLRAMIMGAAGFPVADLGDEISKSLRFRGGQSLDVTSTLGAGQDDQTLSFWFKRGDGFSSSGGSYYLVNNTQSGGGTGTCEMALTEWSGDIVLQHVSTVSTATGKYRDPSGWYHIVYQCTSSGSKLFINNTEVISSSNFKKLISGLFRIGKFNTGSFLKGYLADMWAVDGQALSPSSFARTTSDGVWVPKNYTGSVGTNGFHLTFDSSQTNGIGHDSSGSGNHFTASGFDTADAALYSADLFTGTNGSTSFDWDTTDKNFASGSGAELGFNDAATATGSNANNSLIFRPTPALTGVTEIAVEVDSTTYILGLNGSDVTSQDSMGSAGYKRATLPGGFDGVVSSFGIRNANSGQACSFSRIRINGSTVLVDNTDNDVDYLDTPTNNYSTLQPLGFISGNLSGNPSPTNANLGFTISSNPDIAFTYYLLPTSGKYYFEIIPPSATAGESGLRLYIPATANTSKNGTGTVADLLSQGDSGLNRWITQNNGSLLPTGNVSKTTQSSRMQVAIDADNKKIYCGDGISDQWVHRDGTYQISAFDATKPTIDYSSLTGDAQLGIYGTTNTQVNFGQMPFVFTQPTGFDATTVFRSGSLPEPTIKNGKDHFGVLTYTGAGSSANITGLNFKPDLVWIKNRDAADFHTIYDSVRGVGLRLIANDTDGEFNQSNSLNGFLSNGFSTGGHNSVYGSGEDYVAWCWKAGGTAVSNTDGTITSSVSANTDAGFSIVSYTGTATNATVGHGLNSTPDVVVVKGRSFVDQWHVKHKDLSSNNYSVRFNSSAQEADFSVWQNTAPTSTVFSIGTQDGVNKSGADFIAYCWHSVEGFSKFDTWTGTANADGPFIYTGFKPAFLMLKCASHSGDWVLYDTTRDPNNLTTATALVSNAPSPEASAGSYGCDILSNGFKIRTTDSTLNGSGRTYIYMAFAEHPSGGGENVAPATAR